jgi:MraZ protein
MQVALDKAGRICLPEAMASLAGITKEAVLVGLLDRFEIWSPDRYAEVRSDDQGMAGTAFSLME